MLPRIICPFWTTTFPSRSSPSVIGGTSVTVIAEILLRFVARAKSSCEKTMGFPHKEAFAIAFSSARMNRAGEMAADGSLAATSIDVEDVAPKKKNKNVKQKEKSVRTRFLFGFMMCSSLILVEAWISISVCAKERFIPFFKSFSQTNLTIDRNKRIIKMQQRRRGTQWKSKKF